MVPASRRPAVPPEAVALARAELVQHYLRAAAARGRRQGRLEAKRDFLLAYNTGQLFPELYGKLGEVSFATIERWAKRYRESGEAQALARRGAGGRGPGVSEAAAKILLAVALHPNRLRLTEVVRAARRIMAQQGVADGLSDRTYLRFLAQWRERNFDQWVFWRQGEQALHQECLPYLERDYSRIEVGDALVADGHRLNFEIINPWTGKAKRMVLILFYDMASNYPCGWEIMPEENVQAIAAAFRRALLTLGRPPASVYLDNGKAFGAKFFSTNLAEAGFAGLFNRLGVEVIYAWPYHGQSKTVERFFQVFGEFERLMPSYVGTGIEDKPARLHRGEKLHRRLHGRLTGGAVPTLAEAQEAIQGWMAEYVDRPQERSHLQGATPRQVFEAWRQRSGYPEMDREELRHLMMAAANRTINRNGVALFGTNYYSPELYGRRHAVLVRYDLHDLTSVLVYDQGTGEFLCEAAAVPGVHPLAGVTGTAADREAVAAQIGQKRQLLRQTTAGARQLAAEIIGKREEGRGNREEGTGKREEGKGKRDEIEALERELWERRQAAEIIGKREEGRGNREEAIGNREKGKGKRDEIEALERELWERRHCLPALPSADWQRYEGLLAKEAAGDLEMEEAVFMRYFESGSEYRQNQEYFEERRLAVIRHRVRRATYEVV